MKIVKILESEYFRGSSGNDQKVFPRGPNIVKILSKSTPGTIFRQYLHSKKVSVQKSCDRIMMKKKKVLIKWSYIFDGIIRKSQE